ncbi:MAG TPA: hypothetical protein VMS55_19230 [Myxococcota bacterium]|nr:hypothetical protein [Myxococcota bacterium]
MRPESRLYIGCAVYGLLVLAGIAVLGFVVAPFVGVATRLFAIDTESAAFFSLLTLKGAPYWGGLGVMSSALYGPLAGRRAPVWIAAYASNVALAWLAGAGIAMFELG